MSICDKGLKPATSGAKVVTSSALKRPPPRPKPTETMEARFHFLFALLIIYCAIFHFLCNLLQPPSKCAKVPQVPTHAMLILEDF